MTILILDALAAPLVLGYLPFTASLPPLPKGAFEDPKDLPGTH